jgi:drug/metabolite transporter (DMT)-like permease
MTPLATPRQRRLAYAAWVAVCLIWGTTYLGIRVSLESMPPMLMGGLRWTLAGGVLALYLVARGQKLPPRSRWSGIALLGFLMLVLGNGGVVVAEQWIPSGLAAVLVATSPFWMAGVEALLPDGDRMRLPVIIGLLIGFLGIVVLVWPEISTGSASASMFVVGVIATQIACVGWSAGSAYSRRHRQDDVLGSTALQMLAGGVMMLALGTLRGEWADLFFAPRSLTAFVYLSTIGAIGGFVAYTYALRYLPVSFVSLYAYINPLIAVVLGIVLLSEPFDLRMAIAAALVLAGVGVVRWNPQSRSDEPATSRTSPIAPLKANTTTPSAR